MFIGKSSFLILNNAIYTSQRGLVALKIQKNLNLFLVTSQNQNRNDFCTKPPEKDQPDQFDLTKKIDQLEKFDQPKKVGQSNTTDQHDQFDQSKKIDQPKKFDQPQKIDHRHDQLDQLKTFDQLDYLDQPRKFHRPDQFDQSKKIFSARFHRRSLNPSSRIFSMLPPKDKQENVNKLDENTEKNENVSKIPKFKARRSKLSVEDRVKAMLGDTEK